MSLEDGVAEMISEYTMEGRKAVNLLADAYSLAVYEAGSAGKNFISREIMRRTARGSRLTISHHKMASDVPEVGHVFGLGVSGFSGSTIEIEAAAYPAKEAGKGDAPF